MSILHLTKKISLAAVLALSVGATSLTAGPCDRRAFNISVNDVVTLNEMLTQLADVCKFSVIAKDAVAAQELNKPLQGVSIKDLTLREIFNLLIAENNLSYTYNRNALIISALQTKTFKVDYITSTREATARVQASVDSGPKEVNGDDETKDMTQVDNAILSKERIDFWEKIGNEISSILNNGTEKYVAAAPIINKNAGLVTVTGTRSQLQRVQRYIDTMQQRIEKQVMLDVNIIAVELNNNYTTGIDWSKFQVGFGSYFQNQRGASGHGNRFDASLGRPIQDGAAWRFGAALGVNLQGVINFLEEKGKTKVISSPKVTTLNNQPAIISVGDTFYYIIPDGATVVDNTVVANGGTQYSSFVGIMLNILPEISDNNRIMLRINPSVSELKNPEDALRRVDENGNPEPRQVAPDTKQKKISSVVWCDSGDTIILGGLIGVNKDKKQNGVPVLRDIPLIGGLFRSTKDQVSTTELVFMITPRIISSSKVPTSTSLKSLGFSKSLANDA